MFALRRNCARPTSLNAWRANSTVSIEAKPAQPPPPPPPVTKPSAKTRSGKHENVTTGVAAETSEGVQPTAQGRTLRKRRQRPAISLEKPKQWSRPLAKGVVPAYDEALKLIQKDSEALVAEANTLREELKALEAGEGANAEKLDSLKAKLQILEVQSQVNLPDVRWKFSNAMVDMSSPVHRHLMEQKWRKDGDLDLLMERIHQMKVVPDVLPDLHPSIDLRIAVPSSREQFRETQKPHASVEPGVFLLPHQTLKPPRVYANVFHPDTRLYTLLLVDPDVPDEVNQTYTTYLHWLQPNVPLSATSQSRIVNINDHTSYIPPHPQRGTPYHRYVLLMLPQSDPIKPLDVPTVPDSARLGFNVRSFLAEWRLDSAKGGGAHMWRELWNEDVSKIYADVLHVEEPKYGRPPKPDRYADVKRVKKYI
ncbi:hypothetical protein ONZ45_g14871 [Pleurotus djamor]|nr:hypothetical protein ONZ45_g14871 [Pleurotus djamor]